jgi:hypothetical protein
VSRSPRSASSANSARRCTSAISCACFASAAHCGVPVIDAIRMLLGLSASVTSPSLPRRATGSRSRAGPGGGGADDARTSGARARYEHLVDQCRSLVSGRRPAWTPRRRRARGGQVGVPGLAPCRRRYGEPIDRPSDHQDRSTGKMTQLICAITAVTRLRTTGPARRPLPEQRTNSYDETREHQASEDCMDRRGVDSIDRPESAGLRLPGPSAANHVLPPQTRAGERHEAEPRQRLTETATHPRPARGEPAPTDRGLGIQQRPSQQIIETISRRIVARCRPRLRTSQADSSSAEHSLGDVGAGSSVTCRRERLERERRAGAEQCWSDGWRLQLLEHPCEQHE